MAICPNCKAKLECGCQRRTASDGTSCCELCLKKYEEILKSKEAKNNG